MTFNRVPVYFNLEKKKFIPYLEFKNDRVTPYKEVSYVNGIGLVYLDRKTDTLVKFEEEGFKGGTIFQLGEKHSIALNNNPDIKSTLIIHIEENAIIPREEQVAYFHTGSYWVKIPGLFYE